MKTVKRINAYGTIRYHKKGNSSFWHNEHGPALIYTYGGKAYYLNNRFISATTPDQSQLLNITAINKYLIALKKYKEEK